MDLKDAVVVVIGGSSGLGRRTAELLVGRGSRVVLVSRNAAEGNAVAREIGARAHFAADVRDSDALITAFTSSLEIGSLRGIVVCAAIGHAERTVGRDAAYATAHSLDSFRETVDVNLIGSFNCVRLGATAIGQSTPDDEGNRGAILLTSSLAGRSGQVGQAAYAASKAALSGMVIPVARDLAPLGIRVNVIRPGGFDTPMYGKDGVDDRLRAKLGDQAIFPHRMGRASEYASLACELLTNDYMNATTVDLDAGTQILPRG